MKGNFAFRNFSSKDSEAYDRHWEKFLRNDNGKTYMAFENFASYWNSELQLVEGVSRKTSTHLREYHKKILNDENVKAVYASIRKEDKSVQETMKVPDKLPSTRIATQEFRVEGPPIASRIEVRELNQSRSGKLLDAFTDDKRTFRGSSNDVAASSMASSSEKRIQVCLECGHYRLAFKSTHVKGEGCTNEIVRDKWSKDNHLRMKRKVRNYYSPCDCPVCTMFQAEFSRREGMKRTKQEAECNEEMICEKKPRIASGESHTVFDKLRSTCSDDNSADEDVLFSCQAYSITFRDICTCQPNRWVTDAVRSTSRSLRNLTSFPR